MKVSSKSLESTSPLIDEFFTAIKENNVLKIKTLIEKDKNLIFVEDQQNFDGLEVASDLNCLEIIEILLKNGATYNHSAKFNALHMAAQNNHDKAVELLLTEGKFPINSQDQEGDTPLHMAAFKGHYKVVKILMAAGARSNIKNNDGLDPVEIAVEKSYPAIIKESVHLNRNTEVVRPDQVNTDGYRDDIIYSLPRFYYDFGYYLNISGNYSINPESRNWSKLAIYLSATYKHIETARSFFTSENIIPKDYSYLLVGNAYSNRTEIVKILLNNRVVDVNFKRANTYCLNKTALYYAIQNNNHAMVEALLEKGANFKSKEIEDMAILKDNITVIKLFSTENTFDILKKLEKSKIAKLKELFYLEAKQTRFDNKVKENFEIVIEELDKYEKIAKEVIAELTSKILYSGGRERIIKNVDKFNIEDLSKIFILACKCKVFDVCNAILRRDKNLIDAYDGAGKTALIYANSLEMLEYLLKNNANLNLKSKENGYTALHAMILRRDDEAAKKLINKGANIFAKTNNGDSIIDFALNDKRFEVIILLLNKGVKINDAAEEIKQTFLYQVALANNLDFVKLMLDNGVQLNEKNQEIYIESINSKTNWGSIRSNPSKEFDQFQPEATIDQIKKRFTTASILIGRTDFTAKQLAKFLIEAENFIKANPTTSLEVKAESFVKYDPTIYLELINLIEETYISGDGSITDHFSNYS